MPPVAPNYFRYFASAPEIKQWGIGLTASGWTRIPANSPYPPVRHPTDHHFDWDHGRVLEAMQIVLISDGAGIVETRATGRRRIESGWAFALLPGTWHRYRPESATGWTESWIEVRGPVVDRLCRADVFSPRDPCKRVDPAVGLDGALEAVHVRARAAGGGFDAELGAAALGVLAAWEKSRPGRRADSRAFQAVAKGERYLREHLTEPIDIAALARKLGIAYSHFRRAFRARTGFSPWQYVLHLRIAQARRILASNAATLDEIAGQLGFSSAFHLSSAFKREMGQSPRNWLRQFASDAPRRIE